MPQPVIDALVCRTGEGGDLESNSVYPSLLLKSPTNAQVFFEKSDRHHWIAQSCRSMCLQLPQKRAHLGPTHGNESFQELQCHHRTPPPPVTEREERTLQNFFPFLRLPEEEEKEVLGLDDAKDEPFSEAGMDDWASVRLEDCLQ